MEKFHLHSGLALQCRLGPVGKKTTCLRRVTKLLVNDLADIIAAQNSINLGSDTHRKERWWWKAEGAGGKKNASTLSANIDLWGGPYTENMSSRHTYAFCHGSY